MRKTITTYLFSFAFLFSFSIQVSAQNEKCATDELHNYLLANDAVYKAKNDAFEEAMLSNRNSTNKVTGGQIYKIPVVVHVMHKGEPLGSGTNVSDAAILNGIKALNERYRKVAGSVGDGNGVDAEIEFALAVRDPNGNCTNGITRNDMSANTDYMSFGVKRSGANGITDAQLKAVISWSKLDYYNIWLISEIDDNNGGSGTQGYAFYASSHGSASDGAVVLVNSLVNTSRITTAHELGHALNLYHTFEGDASGASCPVGNGCGSGSGDCCLDTPPHIRTSVSTCTDVANSCDGGSSADLHIHNYLDYSSDACQNEFTADQKARMIAALTTLRSSFLESNGNMSLVPPTTAGVNFNATSSIICLGQTVDFTDASLCTPNTFLNTPWMGITFNWSITNNSGTTYTSGLQNPTITFNAAGTYDVTLSITNVNGTTSYTRQGMVVVSAAPVAATCTGTSSSVSTLSYGIYSVKLNGMTHTSSSTYNDIQSGLTNASGYGDFSCDAGTILEANTTYTIELKGTSSASLVEDFKVFIDYNNDGDFGDLGEEVAVFDNVTGSSAYIDTTFTTPASPSLNVPLRMRVFSARSTETITSCGTTTRGQIQDYSVRITDKVARVSISVSPNDTINYGTNVTFTASPVNGGTSPVYKWYKNNTLIAGANAVTYSSTTLNDADQIYCEMISNLANVIASPCTSNVVVMDVTGAVGINNLNYKVEFEMLPNPAHETVNLNLSLLNGEQATITIENMLGQEMCTMQTTQHLNQLNVSTFAPGIYFVRVQKGNAYSVKRLIVN